jgi:hypothetical protein
MIFSSLQIDKFSELQVTRIRKKILLRKSICLSHRHPASSNGYAAGARTCEMGAALVPLKCTVLTMVWYRIFEKYAPFLVECKMKHGDRAYILI